MAFAAAVTPPPLFLVRSKRISSTSPTKVPISTLSGGRRCLTVVAKAVGDNSDSDASIVKFVQNAWSSSEDRIALVGLGFAAIVAFWTASNIIGAIDKLPLIPSTFEFIGILFSWWFVYRYLLFKPDREELSKIVKNAISTVLGK